jgi:hypothetical protein
MSVIKEQCMNVWMTLAIVALLAGCASKRAVPVDCGRRLSPINVPAAIADPVKDESQAPEMPQS